MRAEPVEESALSTRGSNAVLGTFAGCWAAAAEATAVLAAS
jgi:hypothetical protein